MDAVDDRTSSREFGVYLHVPFCSRRCDYCAFATWADRHHLQQSYMEALLADVRRADLTPVTSVFVGGGTPTLVDPHLLAAVLRASEEGASICMLRRHRLAMLRAWVEQCAKRYGGLIR